MSLENITKQNFKDIYCRNFTCTGTATGNFPANLEPGEPNQFLKTNSLGSVAWQDFNLQNIPHGSANQVLTTNGIDEIVWANPGGGGADIKGVVDSVIDPGVKVATLLESPTTADTFVILDNGSSTLEIRNKDKTVEVSSYNINLDIQDDPFGGGGQINIKTETEGQINIESGSGGLNVISKSNTLKLSAVNSSDVGSSYEIDQYGETYIKLGPARDFHIQGMNQEIEFPPSQYPYVLRMDTSGIVKKISQIHWNRSYGEVFVMSSPPSAGPTLGVPGNTLQQNGDTLNFNAFGYSAAANTGRLDLVLYYKYDGNDETYTFTLPSDVDLLQFRYNVTISLISGGVDLDAAHIVIALTVNGVTNTIDLYSATTKLVDLLEDMSVQMRYQSGTENVSVLSMYGNLITRNPY